MENRKEIILGGNSKSLLVYAKVSKNYAYHSDWLILISSTHCDYQGVLKVVRHASYNLKSGDFFISEFPRDWGNILSYRFFEPTEEEKRFMVDKIRENGYKYVPILNKLIRK